MILGYPAVDWVIALFLLAGGVFCFAAGLGLLRMPDVFVRMHASTKAGTLGVGLIMVALSLHFWEISVIARAMAVLLFVLLTAPVAAHLLGRAAYRAGVPLWSGSVRDEWAAHGHEPAPPPPPSADQAEEPKG